MNYLMLNKNDITEVCGVITRKEVVKEIGELELANILTVPKLHSFRGKYLLVEENFEDEFKEITVKLHENKTHFWLITNIGEFYKVSKRTKHKQKLTPYLKKDCMWVKINSKDFSCKSLLAMVFINEWKRGDIVLHKDGNIRNLKTNNLIVIPKEVYAKVTGPKSRSQAVGLFENGSLIRKWSSARKCAKDMHCSYQMIMDYCNKKVKKPEFDVRWL